MYEYNFCSWFIKFNEKYYTEGFTSRPLHSSSHFCHSSPPLFSLRASSVPLSFQIQEVGGAAGKVDRGFSSSPARVLMALNGAYYYLDQWFSECMSGPLGGCNFISGGCEKSGLHHLGSSHWATTTWNGALFFRCRRDACRPWLCIFGPRQDLAGACMSWWAALLLADGPNIQYWKETHCNNADGFDISLAKNLTPSRMLLDGIFHLSWTGCPVVSAVAEKDGASSPTFHLPECPSWRLCFIAHFN